MAPPSDIQDYLASMKVITLEPDDPEFTACFQKDGWTRSQHLRQKAAKISGPMSKLSNRFQS